MPADPLSHLIEFLKKDADGNYFSNNKTQKIYRF